MEKVRVSQQLSHSSVTLKEYIEILQNRLASIPDEAKDSATIVFDIECSYGDYYVSMETAYWREETELEAANRVAKEKVRQDEIRARELQTLEELKSKYPNNIS